MQSSIDKKMKEAAWRLACNSTYNEDVGMQTAARLLLLTEDRGVRLALAAQVSDEARHSEVFARYARSVAGDVRVRQETSEALDNSLSAIENPIELFIAHTLLEGFALDQFSLLRVAFAGDPIACIYENVGRDEAIHVAVGMEYVSAVVQKLSSDEVHRLMRWCTTSGVLASVIDDDFVASMAALCGKTENDVRARFESNQSRRLGRLFKLKGPSNEGSST